MSDEQTPPAGDVPPHRLPRARRRGSHGDADSREPTDPAGPAPGDGGSGGNGNGAPRVYKLRLALILAGLGALAVVSTVFGMMMAVASELPALETRQEYRNARNSILYDVRGRQLGVLTSRYNRILVQPSQVSAAMQHAIISVEDKRFYENNGVDIQGIARALIADIARRKTVQGASTISQQFVKNALAAQDQRTLFQKLRESALAYHLNRKWDKRKILTEYLNAVYFGNGAYGVESAARTYFRFNHPGCGTAGQPPCASLLTPAESALIAGMVASPAAFDPLSNPRAAIQRRNFVLDRMLEQGYITIDERDEGKDDPAPDATTITLPREDSAAPYFTTWVKQQVIERFGVQRALNGGLKVRTTLDLDLQQSAEQAISGYLTSSDGPAASLVAIDNRTGEVRAMVGGRPGLDYNQAPFNLATQGQRQPGSAFKVFTLAQALRDGISPYSTWESKRKFFDVPKSRDPNEKFVVRNYEGRYSGVTTLASATAESDNSVFAEVGLKLGTRKIARLAQEFGIRTPISTNPAMILGGLEQGVTPLDMAHAYETLAAGGKRVTGTLAADDAGPVGIKWIEDPRRKKGRIVERNRPIRTRVVSEKLAEAETEMLKSVITSGTGKSAATGGFAAGKTGTTENYGDAWFIGYNKRWTVAVWVGYPDRLKPMETEFNGGPVNGGSFPALIWRSFMVAADQIQNQRDAEKAAREGREYTPPDEAQGEVAATQENSGSSTATDSQPDSGSTQHPDSSPSSPGTGGGGGGGGPAGGGDGPPAAPPPSGGGGGSGGGTGAPGGTAPQG